MLRRLFQYFLFVYAGISFAQEKQFIKTDSLHYRKYDSRYYLFDQRTASNVSRDDSSFNQLPNYFQRNWLGNIGLPDYAYLLRYNNAPLGLRWFSSPYDDRLFGLEPNVYYSQGGIYSSIFGAAGSKKEQVLKLLHVQNVNERLNFTLKLNRYASDGFYVFQQSFVNNVLFSSNYISKKKRFGYFASYSFDRFKHFENGGITSDTSIVNDPLVGKNLLPVHLENARRNYSLMCANASLFFRLNRDSVAKLNHLLLLGAKGSVNKSQYADVPSSYYSSIYTDSTLTRDTTNFMKLSPSLSYDLNTQYFNFELGGRYDISTWKARDSSATNYASIIAFQALAWRDAMDRIIVKENASYIASGENSGDYQANLSADYNFTLLGPSYLRVELSHENRSPDLFFRYYSSNNFLWTNHFNKTQTTQAQALFFHTKAQLRLGAVYSTTTNLILLGNNSLPVQFNQSIQAIRLFVQHHLKLYKVHLENEIHYQSTNSYAYALPPLYTKHQLYFEQRVKKNGLRWQVGVQANYIAKMDILSYNPALNSFYLRYGAAPKGNYVFGDFFFNVYFRPVKFFFKVEHLNQGFTGIDYTFVNGYYQPDRAFRFGVNWEFWD